MERYNNSLFIKTIDDLKLKSNSNDEYDLLMSSTLIRKLLIDGNICLVHPVNKPIRLKVKFHVTDSKRVLEHSNNTNEIFLNKRFVDFWSIADGLDPDTQIMKAPIINVSIDKFLTLPVIQILEKRYSIKEIVLFFANSMGGVHRGNFKEYETVLVSLKL